MDRRAPGRGPLAGLDRADAIAFVQIISAIRSGYADCHLGSQTCRNEQLQLALVAIARDNASPSRWVDAGHEASAGCDKGALEPHFLREQCRPGTRARRVWIGPVCTRRPIS
jgi:hypothetical protein